MKIQIEKQTHNHPFEATFLIEYYYQMKVCTCLLYKNDRSVHFDHEEIT